MRNKGAMDWRYRAYLLKLPDDGRSVHFVYVEFAVEKDAQFRGRFRGIH
jgi:hypothetical protein